METYEFRITYTENLQVERRWEKWTKDVEVLENSPDMAWSKVVAMLDHVPIEVVSIERIFQ